jgi:hypothetical protein
VRITETETTMKLQAAFKEWAVICRALALGKQSIILRKGGIAETSGEFTIEHSHFWLYPTYLHQQRDGVRAEAMPLLEEAEAARPAVGTLSLSHWAEVTGIYRVRDLTRALLLAHLHFWSDETVRQRFHYRELGIYVLAVRVYRAPLVHTITESTTYAGCKSWVELEAPLDTAGSTPVLSDEDYEDVKWNLEMLLEPRGLA